MTARTIKFKKPLHILHALDTAVKMEKEKYKSIPVGHDMIPMHDALRAWSYVVSGYFLVEQSFKGLLVVRKKKVPRIHSLTRLFKRFDKNDKVTLREYYTDFRAVICGGNTYPFETLEDFLVNLDGDLEEFNDEFIGSFDWRYMLIEDRQSDKFPFASVDFMHEIAYGATRIIHHAYNKIEDPRHVTISWRKRWIRKEKYEHWLTVRANTEGSDNLGDRLEILWGPDYRGRFDMLIFSGNTRRLCFAEKPRDHHLIEIDKRTEVENFNVEEGYEGISATIRLPSNDH